MVCWSLWASLIQGENPLPENLYAINILYGSPLSWIGFLVSSNKCGNKLAEPGTVAHHSQCSLGSLGWQITWILEFKMNMGNIAKEMFNSQKARGTDDCVYLQAVVAGIQQAHAEQLANMRIQDLKVSLKPLHSVNNPILRKRKLLG